MRIDYDTEDNVVVLVNEAGDAHTFRHDARGHVIEERHFDGVTKRYTRDAVGRCARVESGGESVAFERDPAGRILVMTAVDRRGGEAMSRFEYDPAGRLVRALNEADDVRIGYDAAGRVAWEVSAGRTIARTYNGAGELAARRCDVGFESAYAYGPGGVLAEVATVDTRFGDFSRAAIEAHGDVRAPFRVTFLRGEYGAERERHATGGTVVRSDRDAFGRPVSVRARHGEREIASTGIRWAGLDRVEALIDPSRGVTRFFHDARGYLVRAERSDGRVTHRAVDAAGNLYEDPARGDRTYDTSGRIVRSPVGAYTYDARGRLSELGRDGARWRYDWDALGQLRAVERPDGALVTFAYDALGRRVEKRSGSSSTRYLWDGDRVACELKGERAVLWEYDGLTPVARVEGARRHAVLSDHLGAPTALVTEDGRVEWSASLDLWGRREGGDANLCPWRWPGQYEDPETGLYYNRFRYYDPADGRYISPDPVGMLGGSRPYGYVADPLTGFDSLGLAFEPKELTEGTIYRQGSGSDMSLTPRPGKDDVLRPGDTHAGLSTSIHQPPPGEKAVALDVAKLREQGLMVLQDKPNGHVTIYPVDAEGKFDHARLQQWSSTRPKLESGGKADELTEKVKKCKA